LYESSRRLASEAADANALGSLLENFRNRLPGLRLSLCLHGEPGQQVEKLVALHSDRVREICSPRDCALCSLHGSDNLLCCPVVNLGSELGELRSEERRVGKECGSRRWPYPEIEHRRLEAVGH